MSCPQFVSFDFVEGSYTLRMVERKRATGDTNLVCRNELNTISFPNFTAMEFNIFFTICYFISEHIKSNGGLAKMIKIAEEESVMDILNSYINNNSFDLFSSENERKNLIEVKFDDLRIFLPNLKDKKRFYRGIADFVRYKLKNVGVERDRINRKSKLKVANFFSSIEVDEEEEKLFFSLSPFSYSMFGKFDSFMSFDVKEFCSFENKYTKSLFRLVKQYENSKSQTIYINKEEFKEFMDAPYNYRVKDLESRVIKPSIKEIKLKSVLSGGFVKHYSIKNIDYEKLYHEIAENQEQPKLKRVKGFKFVFEKRLEE